MYGAWCFQPTINYFVIFCMVRSFSWKHCSPFHYVGHH